MQEVINLYTSLRGHDMWKREMKRYGSKQN